MATTAERDAIIGFINVEAIGISSFIWRTKNKKLRLKVKKVDRKKPMKYPFRPYRGLAIKK